MLTSLLGCNLREILHVGNHTVLYRGQRRADAVPVVLKVLKEPHPSPRLLAALRHEYELLCDCAPDGAVTPYGLEEEAGRWGIVMEDCEGGSLAEAGLAGTLPAQELLTVALSLTALLDGVHRHRVVHKDFNPSNIVLQSRAGRRVFKLIDFGIATVLADERAAFGSPSALEGSLAYLSPEQTGRMNRTIDERSDLYALGVTLFELATGRLPFETEDPLELVHCHIARRPPSAADLNPALPETLARIILKLLSKNADERYQSTRGLSADLERCLEALRRDGTCAPFELGTHDLSRRLHFPQKLYGRELEVQRLLECLNESMRGAVLMLVAGPAGIGKTSLIQEVHRPLTERCGSFVSGKFNQYQNAPYSALLQALQSLIQSLLMESEASLGEWRGRILGALESNVGVLTEMCPSLSLIVGPRAAPPRLAPDEARARLHDSVYRFMALFAKPEHPLCVFVDDLQWADLDSLKLLQDLLHMARDRSLLLIGAYRDLEVGPSHPLHLTTQQLEAQGTKVHRITLALLHRGELAQLLGDTLGAPPGAIAPLAELVLARTGGNPFFVRTFLTSLHEDGLLQRTAQGWHFDLHRIRERGVSDNVVDLLASHIERLPRSTQGLLRWAACIGSRFDLGTLAAVAASSVEETGRELWAAVAEELVIALDRVHSPVEAALAGPELSFRFAHDRIQQAALAPLDEAARARLHADVGRRLLRHFSTEEARERWLFEMVEQLNQGRLAMDGAGELHELARLNLRAARKALQSSAAEPALRYARGGITLLSEADWEQRHELASDLYTVGIEAAFACADLETVEHLSETLIQHAPDAMDKVARTQPIGGPLPYSQMWLAASLETLETRLVHLGFPLPSPATPEAIAAQMRLTEEALAARSFEELVHLPRCTDEQARAALETLHRMVFLALSSMHPLLTPIICRAVRISLLHGNTAESAFAYAFYGLLLTKGSDYDRGARLGSAAIALADDFADHGVRALVYFYAYHHLIHWKQPIHDIAPRLLDAFHYGMQAGNSFTGSAAAITWCIGQFLAGEPLAQVTAGMARYGEVALRLRQTLVKSWLDPFLQCAHHLLKETPDPTRFAGPFLDEASRPAGKHEGDASFHLCKLMLCYLFGDPEGAARHARSWFVDNAVAGTEYIGPPAGLWQSLALLAIFERADEAGRAEIRERVAMNERRFEAALPHCPKTIAHKLELVRAERARVEVRDADARGHFERAVTLARQSGYVQEEALAHERTARFFLLKGEHRAARDCFRQAHHAYLRWGAVMKAKALEREFPRFVPRVADGSPGSVTFTATSSGEGELNILDLISVINASQAISKEIERDRLLVRLMTLLIETSGAESGALLLDDGGRWFVEAAQDVEQGQSMVLQSLPLEELESRGHRGLPASVVNYVARTGESLVLDDAETSVQFRGDPSIARLRVASVLCFPLSRPSGRLGVVYLENNLMKGAFTPGRIKILQLLSTQAVISLDNAVLYETLEHRVEERTRELQVKNEQLAGAMTQLRQAQDRLILQDRMASLGALTAGIAHELKNPLNFVTNFAELSVGLVREASSALDTPGEESASEMKPFLQDIMSDLQSNALRIKEHGQRMAGIITSMLEHSHGGRGERQETDVNALVEKYAFLAHHGLNSRMPLLDVLLELELDPSVGSLRLVPQELSRVVLNLVDNAGYAVNAKRRILAHPDYKPTIRVSTHNQGAQVELRVHDNGMGIPAAIRDRVFNPFFTTKQTGDGTGLGLSICYDIVVKGNQGSIDFKSVEGQSTEFVVRLPRGTE